MVWFSTLWNRYEGDRNMDALTRGNDLITKYLFDEGAFGSERIDKELKKLLSKFRSSGHVTKELTVRKNFIVLGVEGYLGGEATYEIERRDDLEGYWLYMEAGNDKGSMLLYDKMDGKTLRERIRKTFSLFRTCLDYGKAMSDMANTYPSFLNW